MKTLLIPVDFTPSTQNTINFAAEWAKKYEYERVILLLSFYTSMYENVIMSEGYASMDQEYLNKIREDQKEMLNNLCRDLDEKTGHRIKVQTAVSELPLIRSIMEVIRTEQPIMILLGSDNYNNADESVIAQNVISIARISPVRVLIVPKDYSYQPVHDALVPCDFNAIESLDKINHLRTSSNWVNVQLMVLNVDAKKRYLNPDEKFKKAEKKLSGYLKNFIHKIFYISDKNVINGILDFTKTNKVQLIIALPGQYSFLYKLTHKNVSEALYRNARLPILILK